MKAENTDEKFPQKTKDLVWQRTGEVYILVDKETQQNFTLDPISFLVWIQCDGKTSVNAIADVFAVDGNRDIVKAAISSVLEKLEHGGLIKWV